MIPYQINMARGLVLPLMVRKRWHRWLLVYVFVAAIVCGTALRQAFNRVAALNEQRIQLSCQEHEFQSSRGSQWDMGSHMQQVVRQLSSCEARLEAINRFQVTGHRTAPLLLGLAAALPAGLELGRFETGNGREIRFEVLVPAERRVDESLSPAKLTVLWGKEPLLAGKIESFKTENSERARVGGQSVLSWHFTATLSREP